MKTTASALLICLFFCLANLLAADSNGAIPSVIQKGLSQYEKSGADIAFDAWQRGGLLEGTSRTGSRLRAFKEMTATLGNYRFAEMIQAKPIGASSQIIYLSMNFKRGAVYSSFLLYKTETDWVVQDMYFSTRPEAIMPWLALEREAEAQ